MNYSSTLPLTSNRLSKFDRVRVDVAQTGFFEGREFRTFKELNIAGNALYVVRVVVPVKLILTGLELMLDNGFVRLGIYADGTPSGTFAETLPVFSTNRMTAGVDHRTDYGVGADSVYAAQQVLTAGGGHTGGTEIDVLRVKVATNNSSAASSPLSDSQVRGVPPGTYYFRFQSLNAETVSGMFKLRWEERP